jgi:hypothetical protein
MNGRETPENFDDLQEIMSEQLDKLTSGKATKEDIKQADAEGKRIVKILKQARAKLKPGKKRKP